MVAVATPVVLNGNSFRDNPKQATPSAQSGNRSCSHRPSTVRPSVAPTSVRFLHFLLLSYLAAPSYRLDKFQWPFVHNLSMDPWTNFGQTSVSFSGWLGSLPPAGNSATTGNVSAIAWCIVRTLCSLCSLCSFSVAGSFRSWTIMKETKTIH